MVDTEDTAGAVRRLSHIDHVLARLVANLVAAHVILYRSHVVLKQIYTAVNMQSDVIEI